jgi:DNA-binding MarR family transcriptional regulator
VTRPGPTPAKTTAAQTAAALSTAVSRLRSRLRLEGGVLELDLTITQLATLQRVIDDGPLSGAALAAAEHVRPQSMWEIIGVLVKEGLITRGPDPADGRKILVTATDRGRDLVARVYLSREAWLTRAVSAALDKREQRVLAEAVSLLNRLADHPSDVDTK